jgi:hypothetical protein
MHVNGGKEELLDRIHAHVTAVTIKQDGQFLPELRVWLFRLVEKDGLLRQVVPQGCLKDRIQGKHGLVVNLFPRTFQKALAGRSIAGAESRVPKEWL